MTITTPAMRVAFELATKLPRRTHVARDPVYAPRKEFQGRPRPDESALLRARILAASKVYATRREIADAAGCSLPTVARHLKA